MKSRKEKLLNRTLLNLDKATSDQIFNELAAFMMTKVTKHSITRKEASKFWDCSYNKATRLLMEFVHECKLKKDPQVEQLFWLVVD